MLKPHPVFAATSWLLKAAEAFCFFVLAIMVLGLGTLLMAATGLMGDLGIPPVLEGGIARNDALTIGAWALAGILISFVLILFIVRAVAAIVASAMSGDPFVNENAQRLTRTGILLAILIVVELITDVTVNGMMQRMADAHHVPVSAIGGFDFKPDISPIGLFTILLVFVLAQIFRRGSEMRAELEGTV
jgi:hypothetical protein